MHRLAPTAGSLEHSDKDKFSFNVFAYATNYEDIKPHPADIVNGNLQRICEFGRYFLRVKKTFDFLTRTCYCNFNIEMRR